MNLKIIALAACCAATLMACTATTDRSVETGVVEATPQYPDQTPLYSNLDNPMRPDEFQGATILDVDRYRPTYRLTGCESAPLESATPDDELSRAIAAAKTYSDEHKGVGLIVMKDGKLVHESYADGADESTLTASASKMKSVLGLLYGIAIEQGHIGSVDDPIGTYITEWAGEPRGDITLRQMLTMSSGLEQANFMEVIFAPDVAAVALAVDVAGPPDTEFSYGSAISKLSAEVLDRQVRAAGYASMSQYMQAEFWCPMGGGDALVWVDTTGKARGYAGLHASLRDWARIGELVRNKGSANGRQIVPSAWIEEMAKPSKANPSYGLHVWLAGGEAGLRGYGPSSPIKVIQSERFEATDLVFFDGFGGQRVYVLPSDGLTVARSGLVNMEFDDAIIPNLLSRASD